MKAYALRLLLLEMTYAQSSPSFAMWPKKSEDQDSPVAAIETSTVIAGETEDLHPQSQELRRCCVEQLLSSDLAGHLESGWTPLAKGQTRPSGYNCSCVFPKASYFCKNGRTDYPIWVPKAVAEKECALISHDDLAKDPFPPGTSILFYGNSHLRQVVEGIMCQYAGRLVGREASLLLGADYRTLTMEPVEVDKQCRGCMPYYHEELSGAGCMTQEEKKSAMRCCDDQAVYKFDNNVTVHYWFAQHESNKSVEHAFQEFGTSVSDYDVVVANSGNEPAMDIEHIIASAQHFHRVGVEFLWLTTYDGVGDVRGWEMDDQEAFMSAKGNLVPVHDMMETMGSFTRGAATRSRDEHYCLPGPPDELGLLILQLIWTLHEGVPAV